MSSLRPAAKPLYATGVTLQPLLPSEHLAAVMAIETSVYEFPWTRGNFVDSLAAGHIVQVLHSSCGELVGYFVAMQGAAEMHLLNLAVHAAHQSQGHARRMLAAVLALCQQNCHDALWLEVRRSNLRACRLYRQLGFLETGQRKGYYPAAGGLREDATIMRICVAASPSREGPHALD
jgi:[ribosomal protein S18]-alanine N-acetyltransferase